ncbi:hypothetical protein CXQ85_001053 [Candidozyma haemuli]|uniref:Uncharacterized protein n=1 Tax=Candidozyma haemuli TaxID=45357 RepID=A0A2V1ALW5_9ASCO|nr:hypothetical protein CXQ85_001053 [[Candida] haemuloni]PVH18765.1 hypothetical protein CXQ85_001053 [[Candida] haemuloni]
MFNFSNLARLTGFARSASRSVANSQPTITLFHNTKSAHSHHLLKRLSDRPPHNYRLDVRTDQLPSYSTYHFIHEKCINVHPQNARGFERIFPALLASSNHTFCDMEVRKNMKTKQFVPDIDLVSEETYLGKVAHSDAQTVPPFAVDWVNQLIAVDDESLNRVFANYNLTHIVPHGAEKLKGAAVSALDKDHFEPNNDIHHGLATCVSPNSFTSRASAAAMACAVHPHIAEFADLF